MVVALICVIGCLSGFLLFRKNALRAGYVPGAEKVKLSVIIPARNESCNLPHLLHALKIQTLEPFEIIVVDDFSEDDTKEIAEGYGVTVVSNPSLPQGWTGKNWAVWNGYLHATGDMIAFLDADIRLVPRALESLIMARHKAGGVISVVPYHYTVKFVERLALIFNFLGVFAFTSPFERDNPNKGLYGSCILTTREDYEKINGHESIKDEMLDDLNLGAAFRKAGIDVTNFIGYGLVSFRMYAQGIKSQIQGFGKGAVLGTSKLKSGTIVLIACWVVGLIVSETFFLFINTSWWLPLFMGYLLYTLQLFYFVRYVGVFGFLMPVLHIFSTLFFIAVMLYSAYQVVFLGHVAWKGRQVKVGSRREL
ncbi:glycosyltransferase [Paenibacillus aceris]|uniref:4,4'-diaponeurosporenoate glycosyltransferase n=1 Tax=Paenibacillus aceris TaxID=869555 RepID=A0ABS4I6I7_9BACL|nr:glycosyltransferase [Paenibacillus aceris]MBP1966528.1 glycosyltransferase involved in cell wall biosynthesis [Paenibacillus aceris]NHW39499.1 glycosyltransferase [Paenibacillus aceris]